MNIEPLEPRIAPAAVFTFTDVDGDEVTITTSRGTTAELTAILTLANTGLGEELRRIDFSTNSAVFSGTNLTITARPTALGGDGLANVGFIDAGTDGGGGALDLGRIVIRGDLGRIDAGDTALGSPGVKGLTVNSMGLFGTTTQEAGGDLVSRVNGSLGFLKVAGTIRGAIIACDGCGPVTIGGSLQGTSDSLSGRIVSTGGMGPVKIGGDLEGSSGLESGTLRVFGFLASVSIGGSVIGGGNGLSGANGAILVGGGIGSVKIGGSVVGGDGSGSGSVFSGAKLASISIGGSLAGGLGDGSGRITSSEAMGSVKIVGSIVGGGGDESGRVVSESKLASVTLGGSLVGGAGPNSGSLQSTEAMGAVKIGGDIEGGGGANSGKVDSATAFASLTVGGSVVGGMGNVSGSIATGTQLGPVKIGGDLAGGGGQQSGRIMSSGPVASIAVGGSIIGGAASFTGAIFVSDTLGSVIIGGNLEGGSTDAPGVLNTTGAITADRIGKLFIGGSILAGVEGGGGTLVDSGSVRVTNDIGSIVVKGDLVGNPNVPVLITARGQATPSAGKDVAIASLTVEGQVLFADILAGYNINDNPSAVNADAQIGKVVVGDWIASNLVAGVQDDADAARDDDFGEGDDQLVAGGGTATIARIASILIKGTALGSLSVGGDDFGFVAQQIGSLKIGSTVIPLTAGPSNDTSDRLLGISGDLRVREV